MSGEHRAENCKAELVATGQIDPEEEERKKEEWAEQKMEEQRLKRAEGEKDE